MGVVKSLKVITGSILLMLASITVMAMEEEQNERQNNIQQHNTVEPQQDAEKENGLLPNDAQKQMNDKKNDANTMSKFFYDICKKEMLAGMKDGMLNGQYKQEGEKLLADPQIVQDMESMADEICSCAAPKFSEVVMSSLDKPDNAETQKFFEEKAYELIMGCMNENKNQWMNE